jgi:hypothetical protein
MVLLTVKLTTAAETKVNTTIEATSSTNVNPDWLFSFKILTA